MITVTDAFHSIDEVVMAYQYGGVSAEHAMSSIAGIIADYESESD